MSEPDARDVELSCWLDGETQADRRAAVDARLRETPDLGARIAGWRRRDEIVVQRFARVASEPLLASSAEDGKKARPAAAAGERDGPIRVAYFAQRQRRRRVRIVLTLAASFVAGALAILLAADRAGYSPSVLLGLSLRVADPGSPRARIEALAARAADANRTFVRDNVRPIEITGENPRRVDEFLSRRIGVAVSAPSLDEQGTRLLGARLTPGDLAPLGLIVYQDPDGERFGLVIGRANAGDAMAFQVIQRRVSAAVVWMARGAAFVLVGPNDPARLLRLARSIEAREPARAFANGEEGAR